MDTVNAMQDSEQLEHGTHHGEHIGKASLLAGTMPERCATLVVQVRGEHTVHHSHVLSDIEREAPSFFSRAKCAGTDKQYKLELHCAAAPRVLCLQRRSGVQVDLNQVT